MRRRGWSSKRYIRRHINSTNASMAFSNSIYAWLIMSGMVETVTRKPYVATHLDWTIHPRNVMDEEFADRFFAALTVIQSVDRHLMRNMCRYAKLLGYQYKGNVVTADEVLEVVNAVMKVTK